MWPGWLDLHNHGRLPGSHSRLLEYELRIDGRDIWTSWIWILGVCFCLATVTLPDTELNRDMYVNVSRSEIGYVVHMDVCGMHIFK